MRKRMAHPKWHRNVIVGKNTITMGNLKKPVATELSIEEIDEMLTNLDFLDQLALTGRGYYETKA